MMPTTAAPGTIEKVSVMEKRRAARVPLFHPHDARFEGDSRPLEYMKKFKQPSNTIFFGFLSEKTSESA